MNPGNILEIQLQDSKHGPILMSDVSVDVVFFCGGRERYRFDAGTTDAQGHVMAPYELFETIRKDNQSFAVMDYNTRLEDCDPVVVVRAPTLDELSQRLNAVKTWFPDRVSALAERLRLSNNGRLRVEEVRVSVENEAATRVTLLRKA
jgi:hypothetical protein